MTRILVVDDNEQNQYILKLLLEGQSYSVVLARNGIEAMEAAHYTPPDLIISDILMPGMDGFSLCRQWKIDDQLKKIPFIFYTATYTDPKDEDFALSLGAERFVRKPAEVDDFIGIVKDVLNEYKKKMAKPATPQITEEKVFFKKYNEALIRKMEDKMLELEQVNKRLSTLFQTSVDLTTSIPQDELLAYILEKIIDAISCTHVSYFEFNDETKTLQLKAATGFSQKDFERLQHEWEFKLGTKKGLVGMVGQTLDPLIINDLFKDPFWLSAIPSIQSALFLPAVYEEHLIGVWGFLSDIAGKFDEKIVRDLETITNNVAIVIEKNRLFEKIKQSEYRYRTLVETSIDAIVTIDSNGLITDWSRGAEEVFGYNKDERIGKTTDALVPEQHRKQMVEILKEVREKGYKRTWESQLLAKDGRLLDVETTFTYLGEELGFTSILRDVTNQKQGEKALRESEEFLNSIIENMPDMIFVKDARDLRYIRFNKAGEELLGYSRDEMYGKNDYDFFPKKEAEFFVQGDREALRKNQYIEIPEEKLMTKNLGERIIHTKKIPIQDGSGTPLYLLGISEDITERKLASEALRESNERFSRAFEFAPIGMALVGMDGRYLQVNHALCEIVGFPEKELLEKTYQDIADPEDLKTDLDSIRQMLGGEIKMYQIEQRFIHKLDHSIWVFLSVSLIHDQDGKPQYFLFQIFDITKRKHSEQLLNALNKASVATATALTPEIIFTTVAAELAKLNLECMLFPIEDIKTGMFSSCFSYELSALKKFSKPNRTVQEDFPLPIDAIDLFKKVVQGKESLYIENTDEISSQIFPQYAMQVPASFTKFMNTPKIIIAPLIVEEQVIGVFAVQSKNLTIEDAPAVTAFANQLAAAWIKARLTVKLQQTMNGIIQTIAVIVETRDPYTAGHQNRVGDLAAAIAKEMNLPGEQIEGVRIAGIIHDLGKIAVPAEILSKPGKLNANEFNLVKLHPQVGFDMLKNIEFPWPLAQVIFQHHERMNGSGYPQGLKGEEIIFEARIIAVADVVEAMSSHRPYRPSLGLEIAKDEIQKNKGILYDANVVDACLNVFEMGYKLPEATSIQF